MGKPGWEDETWTPGRSSRGGRAENGDRFVSRSPNRDRTDRAGRDDRSERHSSRSSSSRDDYDARDARGSSGGRSGGGGYDDRGRSSRGSYGSSGSSSSSGSSRGSSADGYGSYGRRPSSRDDYRGGSGGSSGGGRDPRERRDGYGSYGGSRSGYDPRDPRMRGPRPPARGDEDTWSPATRGGSSARNRPPAGGGLWGDDPSGTTRRPRPGAAVADMNGRGMGGMAGRPGYNRLQPQGADELPEPKSGFTAGKAVLVVLLMLLLGAGAGFVYFKISAPKAPPDNSIAPVNSGSTPATSSPSTSPSASPSSSPHSFAPHIVGPSSTAHAVITITVQVS